MCRGVEFVEELSGEVSTVALGRFPQRYIIRTEKCAAVDTTGSKPVKPEPDESEHGGNPKVQARAS